nr:MAG TPA: hypothetical protein [Caudoviricetes sp.]
MLSISLKILLFSITLRQKKVLVVNVVMAEVLRNVLA